METGAFPLYEVEHGQHYRVQSQKTRPIGEYLAIQSRFRHLQPAQIDALQADIDAGWARLQRLAALGAAPA